ncbi:hypothetical protein BC567DRAFT_211884 [Phyllosticta citribraziliensis]
MNPNDEFSEKRRSVPTRLPSDKFSASKSNRCQRTPSPAKLGADIKPNTGGGRASSSSKQTGRPDQINTQFLWTMPEGIKVEMDKKQSKFSSRSLVIREENIRECGKRFNNETRRNMDIVKEKFPGREIGTVVAVQTRASSDVRACPGSVLGQRQPNASTKCSALLAPPPATSAAQVAASPARAEAKGPHQAQSDLQDPQVPRKREKGISLRWGSGGEIQRIEAMRRQSRPLGYNGRKRHYISDPLSGMLRPPINRGVLRLPDNAMGIVCPGIQEQTHHNFSLFHKDQQMTDKRNKKQAITAGIAIVDHATIHHPQHRADMDCCANVRIHLPYPVPNLMAWSLERKNRKGDTEGGSVLKSSDTTNPPPTNRPPRTNGGEYDKWSSSIRPTTGRPDDETSPAPTHAQGKEEERGIKPATETVRQGKQGSQPAPPSGRPSLSSPAGGQRKRRQPTVRDTETDTAHARETETL